MVVVGPAAMFSDSGTDAIDWVVAHVLISPISSDSGRSWVFRSSVGLN